MNDVEKTLYQRAISCLTSESYPLVGEPLDAACKLILDVFQISRDRLEADAEIASIKRHLSGIHNQINAAEEKKRALQDRLAAIRAADEEGF